MMSPIMIPSEFIQFLAANYFFASLVAVVCMMVVCSYFIYRNGRERSGKGITLYLVLFFLLCLLFALVSVRDSQNDYGVENEEPTAVISPCYDWEYVINGNKIEIYEVYRKQ